MYPQTRWSACANTPACYVDFAPAPARKTPNQGETSTSKATGISGDEPFPTRRWVDFAVTVTDSDASANSAENAQLSLGRAAARTLATTTKSVPQMRGISSRWLLKVLPLEFGHQADQVFLIAHGKINKVGVGEYGDQTVLGVLADGEHFGSQFLTEDDAIWEFTAKAVTACTVLSLPRSAFAEIMDRSDELWAHIDEFLSGGSEAQNDYGEALIDVASGHDGEPRLPGTFVGYDAQPREYELSVAQTVLRVHSRVADLYNQPMNQIEHPAAAHQRGPARAAGTRTGQQHRLRPAAQRRPLPAHPHPHRAADPGRPRRAASVGVEGSRLLPRPSAGSRRARDSRERRNRTGRLRRP